MGLDSLLMRTVVLCLAYVSFASRKLVLVCICVLVLSSYGEFSADAV